jgi:hypothetical protein
VIAGTLVDGPCVEPVDELPTFWMILGPSETPPTEENCLAAHGQYLKKKQKRDERLEYLKKKAEQGGT